MFPCVGNTYLSKNKDDTLQAGRIKFADDGKAGGIVNNTDGVILKF